jgi:hypothetical protein
VGKEGGREDMLEEMEAIDSLLMQCSLLLRHLEKEGGREGKLEERKSIASFPYFQKDLLLSWQACGKRGRKGGHARGAGIDCFFSLF